MFLYMRLEFCSFVEEYSFDVTIKRIDFEHYVKNRHFSENRQPLGCYSIVIAEHNVFKLLESFKFLKQCQTECQTFCL